MSTSEESSFRGFDVREEDEFDDQGNPICSCGVRSFMAEARRDMKNYGRRFFRCKNYKSKPYYLFKWVDAEFTERSQVVIRKLIAKERYLELELVKKTGEVKAEEGNDDLKEVKGLLKSVRVVVFILLVVSIIGFVRSL